MKYIYSILMLISLLFVGTACENDYRDMVFFTGDAPIYQIGTCDNLTGSVKLYLTKPDGMVVGVDGGDNNYSIINGDNAIATAAFVKSENGYQRIQVTPKAEGQVVIIVRDGSGNSASLQVTVDERVKLVLYKVKEGIAVTGAVTEEQKTEITNAFVNTFTVKLGGSYELLPDNEYEMWEGGVLRVRPDDSTIAPMIGQYERVPVLEGETEQAGLLFTYNEEKHLYRSGALPETTRTSLETAQWDLWEDVTEICPVEVPEGCKVYHIERLSQYNYIEKN